jgi:hypothetical protein
MAITGVHEDRSPRADPARTETVRAASPGRVIVREIAIGGLAGLIAGLLVYGVGGRLFMRIAALVDPVANGLTTSSGNRIGEITLGGTAGFVVAIGLLFGVAAGTIWVVVRPWLPGGSVARALGFGIVMASISPFFVLRPGEQDFRILQPAVSIVAMLVVLAALAGVVVGLVDERLRRRLPPAVPDGARPDAAYLVLTAIGALFLPFVLGGFFSADSDTFRAPVAVGLALVVVGLATVASWVARVRTGSDRRSPALVVVGRSALLIAIGLGIIRLGTDISAILAAELVRS